MFFFPSSDERHYWRNSAVSHRIFFSLFLYYCAVAVNGVDEIEQGCKNDHNFGDTEYYAEGFVDEFGEYGLEHSFEYTSEKVHEQEYHYEAEQERDGFCHDFACNPCYHKVGELERDEQAEEDGAEGDNLLKEAVLKSFVCEPAGRYENDDVNPVHDLFFKALYKRLGEDEVVEHGVVGGKHIAAVAGPFQAALVDEGDGFADGYY